MFGGFYLRITPERFEVFVKSFVSIPVLGLQGDAAGLLIIDGRIGGGGLPGIALMLDVELQFGASVEGAEQTSVLDGIFELRGKVTVFLNTTMREQVFQIPQSFLDLLPEGTPTQITVYAAAPDLNGDPPPAGAVGIYVSASIQGSIKLFDVVTLTGFIGFTAEVGPNGAFVRIAGAVSTTIDYVGSLSGSLDLLLYTNYGGSEGPGIIGRVTLAIADGGAIPNVTLSGQFLLEVNSFLSAKTITTFQTNREADPSYAGPQPNILATDPDTGFFVLGEVEIESGLRLVLEGMLKLGDVVDVVTAVAGG